MADRADTEASAQGLKRKYIDLGDGSFAEAHSDLLRISELTILVWTDTGVATGVVPDSDTEIDVLGVKHIAVQMDSKHVSNTSTDFDVNVICSLDGGTTYDSLPYAQGNVGDDEVRTYLVESKVSRIKLRGDNNAVGTTGYITARVLTSS